MTAPVVVRPATEGDATALAELGARTFRSAYASDMPSAPLEAFVAASFSAALQRAELADPDVRVAIAERGGVPIGYVHAGTGPAPVGVTGDRPIGVARLYLDPAAQGLGVGRALFDWVLGQAADVRADVVWLTVWERNQRAIEIYRHWGFVEVGEVPFAVADEVHRDLVMARPLDPR
jgi:ribosomal protein S18 acetylase RimI-like enzyme